MQPPDPVCRFCGDNCHGGCEAAREQAAIAKRRRLTLYDEKCLDLARYFYPKLTASRLGELASSIQMVVEDFEPLNTEEESASAPAGPRDGLLE